MNGPILIIEDDPDIVDILRFNLQCREYPTRVALNGNEGLMASMDQAQRPSLILLDFLLPGMNGLEICRRLRKEKSTKTIPIIMVTAKTSATDFADAKAAGVDDYSVQKELNVLKHLLRLAVEWEIIPVNHAQGVKSPQVGAGRVRYLQPNELHLLVEASPQWLRQIVIFAVSTGMRRSEVLGLRWLDVDLLNNRVMLPQTKNGDGRIVYLNLSAQSVFESLPIRAKLKPTDKVLMV